MNDDKLSGYRGKLRDLLQSAGVAIGDKIQVILKKRQYEGSLMPRVETADEKHLVLKQKS